jgi:hypothetical protein
MPFFASPLPCSPVHFLPATALASPIQNGCKIAKSKPNGPLGAAGLS